MKFVVKVEAWDDLEGLSVREIGRLTIVSKGAEGETGTYLYTLDEGTAPIVPRPLRSRGTVREFARRQSVWGLIHDVVAQSLRKARN